MLSTSLICKKSVSFVLIATAILLLPLFHACKKKDDPLAENKKPTVMLISPTGTVTISQSDSLTIIADAHDDDGSITAVFFYFDNKLVTSVTKPPYTCLMKNLPEGQHPVSVMAVDDRGDYSSIMHATVYVLPAEKPWINVTYSPEHYYNLSEGDSIVFRVTAGSPFGNISHAKLFLNSALFGEGYSDTCYFTWDPTVRGSWVIQATARDDHAHEITSSSFTLTVNENQPPTISFFSPSDNSWYAPWDSVRFMLNADDPEYHLKKVEVFANNILIKSFSGQPVSGFFEFSWKNMVPGQYELVAKATDRQGLTGTSEILNLTILEGFQTDGLITDIASGNDPDLMFALNTDTKKLMLLNPVTASIAGQVTLPFSSPLACDFAPGNNKLYIGYKFEPKITVYDPVNFQLSQISCSGNVGVTDLEADDVNQRLFVLTSDGTLHVISLPAGPEELSVPSFNADHLSVHDSSHMLFTEKTSGNYVTLYKFSIETAQPVLQQSKQVGYSASQVVTNPAGTTVVVPTSNFNTRISYRVFSYDAADINHVQGEWDFGIWVNYVTFSPDGAILYGVNGDYYDDYIYVNDAVNFTIIKKLPFRQRGEKGIISPNSDGTRIAGITNNGYTPLKSYVFFYDK
ncbi:MAG: Ig-like domain-containing protein [Bacteroidales bacterium]|nr:Ig-like domain-containing protein [Bacteroidales bacterium]